MSDITNYDRAERARKAVENYAGNEYGFGPRSPFPQDYTTAIQDLLSDLLHAVDWNDPEDPHNTPMRMLDMALANYEDEVKEEEEEEEA